MANGLLKKLAIGTAIAGSMFFGGREANAASWNNAYQNMFADSQMVDYTTTLNLNGSVSSKNMALIYYLDCGNNNYAPIAGFNVQAGSSVATGKITRDDPTYYGLLTGQTLDTGSVPSGYWEVVFDYDNDKSFGLIDNMSVSSYQPNEHISNMGGFSINVSGLPSFPSNNAFQSGGIINVYSDVPEPTTGALTALGIAALALRRRRPTDKQSGSKYHK